MTPPSRRWAADAAVTLTVPGFTRTQPILGLMTNLGPNDTAAYYALQAARDLGNERGCYVHVDIHVA